MNIIRQANDKLIERKYIIKINEAQDSIISYKQQYILEQDTIIEDLKGRILEANRINEELQKQYAKERNKKIIYGAIGGGVAVAAVASIVTILVMRK